MFFRQQRRRALFETPFPAAAREGVLRAAPWLEWLAPADLAMAFGLARVLLGEKRFEGCGGLDLDDAMRVSIAVQAAVPILGLDGGCYPGLTSILVYPAAFEARTSSQDEIGVICEGPEDREGETWEQGSLVLSWEEEECPGLYDGLRDFYRQDPAGWPGRPADDG